MLTIRIGTAVPEWRTHFKFKEKLNATTGMYEYTCADITSLVNMNEYYCIQSQITTLNAHKLQLENSVADNSYITNDKYKQTLLDKVTLQTKLRQMLPFTYLGCNRNYVGSNYRNGEYWLAKELATDTSADKYKKIYKVSTKQGTNTLCVNFHTVPMTLVSKRPLQYVDMYFELHKPDKQKELWTLMQNGNYKYVLNMTVYNLEAFDFDGFLYTSGYKDDVISLTIG